MMSQVIEGVKTKDHISISLKLNWTIILHLPMYVFISTISYQILKRTFEGVSQDCVQGFLEFSASTV